MNPWKGLKVLPKEMWVISLAILINRMGTMVLPFLVIYLTNRIGLKAGSAGFVVTFYGLGALITAPFVGKLSDKIGAPTLMKASLFLTGIALILYPFFTSYTSILAITLVWAVVSEAFRPASLSITSALVPAENRKTAFALNRLMINLGMSIGPVLAGFLIERSFSLIFYIDATTSILAGIFLLAFPVKIKEVHKDGSGHVVHENILKDRTFLYFLLSWIPALIVMFQSLGAMPIFLTHDLKFPASNVGLLFAINTVIIIFVEVPLNTAMSKWTYKKSLSLGALLFAVGYGAMALAENIYAIALTIVIWTFGEMILFPASAAYTSEIAPDKKRGEYMGLYQMMFSLGFTLAPWLGTKIYELYGAQMLWGVIFICGVISSFMMLKIKEKPFAHDTYERNNMLESKKEKI